MLTPPSSPIVVGIGASAGGLEAFKKFLGAVPANTGMAFVLVPHLDPRHKSLMAELLAKTTTMEVREAEEGIQLEPNQVYVIPPNKYLSVSQGRLLLMPPPASGASETAIDSFLASLAQAEQERAIAIILSGTGSHGTRGITEIKLAGGMVMAQNPETAEYDQMPRNAIATGMVDYVLPPDEMADALVRYSAQPYVTQKDQAPSLDVMAEPLNRIIALLRARANCDFRSYRRRTLLRRVQRRMGLSQVDDLGAYVEHLRETPEELEALAKDLLIGVTAFFREPDAFGVLRNEVLPGLVERQSGDRPLRVWVPGCATAEEAYSIGMLVLEEFGRQGKSPSLQIFATDIDDNALAVGRHGVYAENIVADVGEERRKRFFTQLDEHRYQVVKQLRDLVMFAHQNLMSDPPFTRQDLISCRNLLIYLEPEVQQKVLALFHFALAEGGYLLLGSSESVGKNAALFHVVSKKWRVFQRVGEPRWALGDIPIVTDRRTRPPAAVPTTWPERQPAIRLSELTHRLLLEAYAPAAVLINRRHEVLYFYGPMSRYLELPTGEPTRDLMSLAQPGLRSRLRAATHRAAQEGKDVSDPEIRILRDGVEIPCKITVKPLAEPKEAEGLLLVTFETVAAPPAPSRAPGKRRSERGLVQQLEYELKAAREDLRNTIADLESVNEELRASNEEVMSMNEELQSANEELETGKEELQSLNEELNTVNAQLHDKADERERVLNDLVNLINSTDTAAVFLDRDLRVKLFTPAAGKVLNLVEADIGRPFRDFAPKHRDENLLSDCKKVLAELVPSERVVGTEGGLHYLRRITPYRTVDNRVNGVVVAYVDVTERMEREAQRLRFSAVMRQSTDPFVLYDLDGHVLHWSRGAQQLYGYSETEGLGLTMFTLTPPASLIEMRRQLATAKRDEHHSPFRMKRVTKDGRILDVFMTLTPVKNEVGKPIALLATTELDMPGGRRVTAEARQAVFGRGKRSLRRPGEEVRESLLREIVEAAADAIVAIDSNGTILSFNPAAVRMFGYKEEEAIGRDFHDLIATALGERRQNILSLTDTDSAGGFGSAREALGRRRDGSLFPLELAVRPLTDEHLFTVVIRDISLRKQMEASLARIAAEQRNQLARELHDGLGAEMAGLGMLAQALETSLERASSAQAGKAEELVRHLDRAREQLRRITQGMMPVEVPGGKLAQYLKELCTTLEKQYDVKCRLKIKSRSKLDGTVGTHLYHIAREAIINALKHGKPKSVRIALTPKPEGIRLTIEDDGTGLVHSPRFAAGSGIRIMQHRAKSIGATLDILPRKDHGTIVACTLPRHRRASSEPAPGARESRSPRRV